ncbi:hypothetical protein NKJ88_05855 [Mesorhizobium sp. M0016]|uniref:hypothetical protein n=1 Tax=Mesorhizobium sp. M0016 TaxID=2956843 RepID=UPI00333D9B0E
MKVINDDCGVSVKIRLHITPTDLSLIRLIAKQSRYAAVQYLENTYKGLSHGDAVALIRKITA